MNLNYVQKKSSRAKFLYLCPSKKHINVFSLIENKFMMMFPRKWILKAVVQKTISILPQREKFNYFFQKNITKGVQLSDEYFNNKLGHAQDHLSYFNIMNPNDFKKRKHAILELGSGWYPIVPVLFYLVEAGPVISVDLQSWMNKETIIIAIRKFFKWEKEGKLSIEKLKINKDRWNQLKDISDKPEKYSFEQIKNTLELTLMIGDARNLPIETDSIDYICSNNTFEHIYTSVLSDILIEFKRIIKPHGIMSHFIDLSDHFAHFDNSITIYNFLKYSTKQWNIIDNSIQPQNRLRFQDYRDMYKNLQIPISKESTRPGNLEELKGIKIHKEFKKYNDKELAISHGYIVSQMPA